MSLTILDANNKLFKWFTTNSSFNFKRDFIKLIPITLEPDDDAASLKLALREFIDAKMVKECDDFYILIQPFTSYTQKLELHPTTAISIADLINYYCEISQCQTERSDSSKITENDILNVLGIVKILSEQMVLKGK